MESLAAVLRKVPLFTELPPGGLAKIIADLREEQHARGTVICYEGEEAHDFYIVKSGELEVLINRSGTQREVVAVVGAHEWFGERALFSHSSRSATMIARTGVEFWGDLLARDRGGDSVLAMVEIDPMTEEQATSRGVGLWLDFLF